MAGIIPRKTALKNRAPGNPASLVSRSHGDGETLLEEAPGLDATTCWQALRSRDRRFDGRFFAGVLTTRVYCRPICPVPLRKPENIMWFPSAASAEAAGFRPCRRCRPHTSPGTPAWLGTSAVVSRALKLICDGELDSSDVEALAERVGIGARHLRRLFVQHLGASPIKIALTRRLHFARNLTEETNLPITKIAFYSGFRSIRQFNHAMQVAFDYSPSELRRLHGRAQSTDRQGGIVIHLSHRLPFDWEGLLRFLAQRATPGVELVEGDCYRRTIEVQGEAGEIEVCPDANNEPRLRVRVKLASYEHLAAVVERVRRLFDLGADPFQVAGDLSRDLRLKPLIDARPGLRMPGAWDGFEVAVRALLGQQLTAMDSAPVVGRLVRAFGKPVETSISELNHLFPRPEALAEADLSSVGIRGARAASLKALARAVSGGQLTFDASKSLEDTLSRLCAVRGIDERTAHYVAMRAFGEPDAFPAFDLGLRRIAGNCGAPASVVELRRIAEAWRPWRAYAAMHLWAADAEAGRRRRTTARTTQSLSRQRR